MNLVSKRRGEEFQIRSVRGRRAVGEDIREFVYGEEDWIITAYERGTLSKLR